MIINYKDETMAIDDTEFKCKSCDHMIRRLIQRKNNGEIKELYFCNNCSKWSDEAKEVAK